MKINFDIKMQRAKKAVEKEPDKSGAWKELADAYENQRNYDESINCLYKALELNAIDESYSIKFDIILYDHLTDLHVKLGQEEKAQDERSKTRTLIEKMEAGVTDDAEQWRDVGFEWARIDHDEAIRCYERATGLDPGNDEGWSYLAWLYLDKKDYENAKRCYEAAINAINWNIDKDFKEQIAAGFWHNLAGVNDKMGDTAGAEKCRRKETEMQEAFVRSQEDNRRADEAALLESMNETITSENSQRILNHVVELLDSGECRTMLGVADVLESEGINRVELGVHVDLEWHDYIIEHVHHELPERWWMVGW